MEHSRILIVEDEGIVATDLGQLLQTMTYEVVGIVSSGTEAVELARTTQPDIVLMDIMLQGPMDGIEAARQIREEIGLAVIYLTAYSDEATLSRARTTEPYGYLVKPFSENELRSTIEMARYKHQTEKKLQESERWLATILKSIGDAVIVTDIDDRITFINAAAQALTGASSDQAYGQPFESIFRILCDDLPVSFNSLRKAEGTTSEKHLKLVHNDGKRKWIEHTVSPLMDERKQVTGHVLTFRDITERKLAEMQLRKLTEAVHQSPTAIAITDAEGLVEYVNPKYCTTTGCTSEHVIGQKLHLLETGETETPAEQTDNIWSTIQSGQVWHGVRHNRQNGDTLHWDAVTISPIKDEAGTITHYVAIQEDISEEKQSEDQKIRVQRMETLSTLSRGIVHDLNNVFSPILMSLDVLRSDLPDGQKRALYSAIEANARRGADLVCQVQTFAGNGNGSRIVMESRDLLWRVEGIVRATIPKSASVKFNIPKQLWRVPCDPQQIHQMLTSLCVGNLELLSDGGTLTVAGENVRLSAPDPPMEPGMARGNYVGITLSHTWRDSQSTGLGQADESAMETARLILHNHGGKLTVTSKPRGRTVTVLLPAEQIEKSGGMSNRTLALPCGRDQTVLVVDDEALTCDIIKETLEAFGYHVFTASDGAEAISLFLSKQHQVRLVLLDVVMPHMDGIATVQVIRKLDPDVVIVGMSGLPTADPSRERFGVQAFLEKPFTAEKLLTTLDEVLLTT